MERRYLSHTIEVRDAADGDKQKIVGYAALFDTANDPELGWKESIDPHAFDDVLSSNPDVRCLWNHDDNHVLGRTKAGTLTLSVDARGLKYECIAPNTQTARDLITSMQRGDIDQSSFGFVVGDDKWSQENGIAVRRINSIRTLFDVSPVTFPAYPDATSGVRSLPDSMPREIRKLVEHRADAPKTKRVDGEDLTADCFLIVGDKDKTATWKLPVKFSDEAKTKNHIRNALARIDQVSGVSAEDLKAAKEKLAALAEKYGVGQQEDKSAEKKSADEPNTYGCECDCDQCTDDNCMECSNPDCDDPNCLLNERSLSQQRALKVDQCTCMCPQCRSGSCGICSAEPQCEGAERNSFSDWYDTVKRELDLD